MTRMIIAGAQLGPIQKADSREAVVARMIDLMNMAADKGYQVWAEIVESTDPTALQFVDGVIEGQDPDSIEMPSAAPVRRAEPRQFLEEVEDNPF